MNSSHDARALAQQLGAGRAVADLLGHRRHAVGDEPLGDGAGDARPVGALGRAGARPGAGGHDGRGPLGVAQAELQHGVAAHAQPDDVGAVDAEPVEHGEEVGDGVLPAVLVAVLGDVRRRVAPGVVGDAAVGAREPADLRLPLAVVGSELVDEHDRVPGPGLLDVEVDVAGLDEGHDG